MSLVKSKEVIAFFEKRHAPDKYFISVDPYKKDGGHSAGHIFYVNADHIITYVNPLTKKDE